MGPRSSTWPAGHSWRAAAPLGGGRGACALSPVPPGTSGPVEPFPLPARPPGPPGLSRLSCSWDQCCCFCWDLLKTTRCRKATGRHFLARVTWNAGLNFQDLFIRRLKNNNNNMQSALCDSGFYTHGFSQLQIKRSILSPRT